MLHATQKRGTGVRIVGASCLVWQGQCLVLEVQKPEKWRLDEHGGVRVGVGCVGGGLEAGETAVDALQREALEEIGCRLALYDAPVTYTVTPDVQVQQQTWYTPGVRPILVWEACLPGLVPGRGVAVFRGRPLGEPAPGDLPALLSMTPAVMLAIGQGDMCLGEALERGATLHARTAIPATVWLELVGTPAVLKLLTARDEPLAAALVEPV